MSSSLCQTVKRSGTTSLLERTSRVGARCPATTCQQPMAKRETTVAVSSGHSFASRWVSKDLTDPCGCWHPRTQRGCQRLLLRRRTGTLGVRPRKLDCVGSVRVVPIGRRRAQRPNRDRPDCRRRASASPRMHALALATSELTLTGRRTRSKSACIAAGGGSFHVRLSDKPWAESSSCASTTNRRFRSRSFPLRWGRFGRETDVHGVGRNRACSFRITAQVCPTASRTRSRVGSHL
jgi:hypothetical protein